MKLCINNISNKICKIIGIMKKLKNYFPEITLKILYNSLINSHLNYGILCWGYRCNSIVKLQKKALRTISNSKYNAHTQPIFKRLRILTVQDILTRKLYKLYFRLVHKKLPEYFQSQYFLQKQQHSHNTRYQPFITPRSRYKFSEYNVRYQLPLELNKNIECIISKVTTHSEFGYCLYIKNYLLNQYETSCGIQSCYICNNN